MIRDSEIGDKNNSQRDKSVKALKGLLISDPDPSGRSVLSRPRDKKVLPSADCTQQAGRGR